MPYGPFAESATAETKFWALCEKKSGCWGWKGRRNKNGYGGLSIDGKEVLAHRLSYEINVGTIPAGMCVCHWCDNPPCTNPEHLFVATHRENIADRTVKGRGGNHKGEANGRAKLGRDDVSRIRLMFRTGEYTKRKLSHSFGVTEQMIGKIVRGHAWSEVAA